MATGDGGPSKLIQVLAVFGILLAVYLLWQQMYSPAFQPCNINATVNCDAIVKGEVAKTLGIPTPLIGLVGYIVILISATLKKTKLLLSMATFGLAFCLYIGIVEIAFLHVICPVCIMCQTIMIMVFGLSVREFRKKGVPVKES